jgi:threonine 3-dehydrogenase
MTESAVVGATQRVPHFLGRGRIGWHERAVPAAGRGELLLRVRANALCGTDRSQLTRGSTITPGHEAAGEVIEAGSGTSTSPGTRGVVYLMDYCGTCRSCASGATNVCLAKRADMGFTHDGGLGVVVIVHETNFFPTPTDLDFASATLLLDVMGTTAHAIRRARMNRDEIESLAVAGAGPIGLGLVAMARLTLRPEVPIIVTDVVPYRLGLAERLGAVPVNLQRETLSRALASAGLSTGADVGIDTSGRESARRGLLDALGRRGTLVCVGHGEGLSVSVSEDLIAPERTVMGSEYFRYDELPGNLDLLLQNRDYLEQIITHRYPMNEVEAAYVAFLAGETGKVVVEQ